MNACLPKKFGLVVCDAKKLPEYFPTIAEPDLIPTEPPFTPDDQLLVDALRWRGHAVSPIIWGTDAEKLASFDGIVIRSPWDYMDSAESRLQFFDWLNTIEKSKPPAYNSPSLMRWLLNKEYLIDFERQGVPIVPTAFVKEWSLSDARELLQTWEALVAKPALSAAGVGLEVIREERDLDRLHEIFRESITPSSPYLFQRLIPEINTEGEWSLIYIDGKFSHAVHKKPGIDTILCHAERGGSLRFADPPRSAVELADKTLGSLPEAFSQNTHKAFDPTLSPLYLRVDVLYSAGQPLLSECEAVDPELFFRARPESCLQFCEALEKRMKMVRQNLC